MKKVDAIPLLKSGVGDNGTLSPNNANFYSMFDKNLSTVSDARFGENSSFGYIGYKFNAPIVICQYKVVVTSYNYSPQSWLFKASNDGVTWVTLDTQPYISVDNWKEKIGAMTIELNNTNPYLYYAILPTSKASSYNGAMYINELTMITLATETKYLIQDKDNNVYKVSNGLLTNLGKIPPTNDLFMKEGFEDLTALNSFGSQLLGISKFKILMYKEK
ncbi:hypothetical protein E4V42_13410 [Clostridium estertheticum]|uniref:Discoidin domain-containing protein n=1 Tax=Clostridium estertheticum TaxID=238834 RepID=A0A5N7IQ42_9CLOT|nr:hypothetical protein [Clostridium estertheticum]MPQ32430.1 hypothetical protein [Clostridium estertheticum]MPQ63089.1 hypothetical protein [Clostridium estertheticum]